MTHHYITHIALAPCSALGGLLIAPDGQTGTIATPKVEWTDLPIVGMAALEVTDEVDDGRHIYTTKLTATLCQRCAPMAQPMAALLTLSDGSLMLIGSYDRPMPTITLADTRPAKPSEQAAATLTMTHAARPLRLLRQ